MASSSESARMSNNRFTRIFSRARWSAGWLVDNCEGCDRETLKPDGMGPYFRSLPCGWMRSIMQWDGLLLEREQK